MSYLAILNESLNEPLDVSEIKKYTLLEIYDLKPKKKQHSPTIQKIFKSGHHWEKPPIKKKMKKPEKPNVEDVNMVIVRKNGRILMWKN